MMITVEPLSDIQEVYRVARETQGLEPTTQLTVAKWKKWLGAEESPIRIFQLRVRMEDIPYWVHVHLVRHHVGIEWFVRTQRPDSINPVVYNRETARQDEPISLTMICNPQSLINVSRRRLCNNASKDTHEVWSAVKRAVRASECVYVSAIAEFMVPDCEYRGFKCYSTKPCGCCK